jgi:hypothetical protein
MEPEALIYVLFFIIVAVVQGIGQKKKEAQKRGQGQPPSSGPREAAGRAPAPEEAEVRAGVGPGKASSEGMIPEGVWDEILGLARGDTPARKSPPEEASPREELPPSGAREVQPPPHRRGQALPGPRREIPRPVLSTPEPGPATPESGMPKPATPKPGLPKRAVPAFRAAATQVPARRQARPRHQAKARGSRPNPRGMLFGDGSGEELRKAIILTEVLGPPLALRPEKE